jgi:N6-adenosine-specific RNA methylase IME4
VKEEQQSREGVVSREGKQLISDGEARRRSLAADLMLEGKEDEAKKLLAACYQIPRGKFGVILADPPWKYSDLGHSRRVDRIYPLLSVQDICALPVEAWAEDDAVLFLWTTSPMLLNEAPKVISAWGFTYKASCVWDKVFFGMGHYWRIQHELVLLATRGRPGCFTDRSIPSIIREKRGPHSRKPVALYDHIERAYPHMRKLELFARSRRPGWTSWGDEIDEQEA